MGQRLNWHSSNKPASPSPPYPIPKGMGWRLATSRRKSPCSKGNLLKANTECHMSTHIQNKALTRKDETLNWSQVKPGELQNAKRTWAQIQEKDVPSNPRVSKKSSERQWGPTPVCLLALEPSLTPIWATKMLTWNRLPVISPAKMWNNWRLPVITPAENCILGSATMVSHRQVPVWLG